MADAVSPYAPGTVGDEPPAPRAPARPALFLGAAFVMMLIGPPLLCPPWTEVVVGAEIAARGSPWFYLLACVPTGLAVLVGLLSDRWPILGTRREGYLFVAALLSAGGWLAALLFRRFWPLVVAAPGLVIAADVIADVSIGGALVEIARRRGMTGRLAAAWVAAAAAAELVELPVTAVVGLPFGSWKVGLCVSLAVIVGIWALVSLDLGPPMSAPTRPILSAHLRTRAFWGPVAVVSVAALARVPSSAIATGQWPDYLLAALFVGQLAGAGCYAFGCRRMALARSGRLALMLNVFVIIALVRAWDQTIVHRTLPVAVLGLVYGFKYAALTDLELRASPPGHEASVLALLTGAYLAGTAVRRLLDDPFGLSVASLTTIAAIAGGAALFGFSLVPASLMASRDGDAAPSSSPAR